MLEKSCQVFPEKFCFVYNHKRLLMFEIRFHLAKGITADVILIPIGTHCLTTIVFDTKVW